MIFGTVLKKFGYANCKMMNHTLKANLLFSIIIVWQLPAWSQVKPTIEYTISIPQPATHKYHVELRARDWNQDTLVFKMPKWTPGYYQIMDYAKSVESISASDDKGKKFSF